MNRPVYARGQCWVSMALSITTGKKDSAVPLLSRLMRANGNTSKFDAAKTLIRVIAPVFGNKKTFVLMDSWYMKMPLISYLFEHNFTAIGQVRKDTALYDLPVKTGKRGRPPKYGKKYSDERVACLEETREEVFLYGKKQIVRYRSAVCLAKFLKGRKVRAVWMQFEDADGNFSKTRLLLATLSDLSAKEIFTFYARRWAIENLFNQMKNNWGWREAWQQSRQVLHRWTQILSVAYALPQLLATYSEEQLQGWLNATPWRRKQPVTAGRIRVGLQMIFGNVRVRNWWNPKCRKFEPPMKPENEPNKDVCAQSRQNVTSNNNNLDANPPPI